MKSARDAFLILLLAAAPLAVPLAVLRPGFVRPLGLGLFALSLPLILLHMLRPRRTPKTIGSVLLWREVELALDARHPFDRLRRNLALFLELLALAALSVAVATPRFRGGAASGRDCVIVIDASASMGAKDERGGASRFEVARVEARERVRGMRSGDRACVIVATPRGARTAQGWTDDVASLDDALKGLECSDGGADLGDALVLAAAAARPLGENAEVLLLSDGGGPALPALDWRGKLRYRALGTSDENLGIVTAERSDEGKGVLVSVLNAGSRPRRAWVELASAEGKTLAARSLELAPRSRAALVLEAEIAPGAVSARVSPADGERDVLAADDVAPLVVGESRQASVALVGSSRPLARALAAAHARVVARVSDDTRLAIFDSPGDAGRSPAVSEEKELPPLPCLVVNPTGPVGPVALGEVLEAPRIAAWDREDRLLRFVSFEDVTVRRARRLVLGASARALITSDAGPIAASWTDGETFRVLLGFDLGETSWPLRLSFPIFVRNLLLAALEDESLGPRRTVRAGSVVSLRARTSEVSVVTPTGREVRVPVEDGRALFADTDRNGLYRVRAGARESVFAVGTLDEEETRVAPRPVLQVGGEGISGLPSLDAGEREVVFPFLLLALFALLLEGFAFHRRW